MTRFALALAITTATLIGTASAQTDCGYSQGYCAPTREQVEEHLAETLAEHDWLHRTRTPHSHGQPWQQDSWRRDSWRRDALRLRTWQHESWRRAHVWTPSPLDHDVAERDWINGW